MKRRRRSNSISLVTAVLVELGTLIAIIALAQPTWTRGIIEHVSQPPAVVDTQPVTAEVAAVPNRWTPSNTTGNTATAWQPANSQQPATAGQPATAWQPAPPNRWNSSSSWNSTRVAQNDRPRGFSGAIEEPLSTAPVYPPAARGFEAPPWNSRY